MSGVFEEETRARQEQRTGPDRGPVGFSVCGLVHFASMRKRRAGVLGLGVRYRFN